MLNNKKIIALLPMKGNSERIPNKNIKKFCDQPLFSIILNKLVAIDLIDEIIINTDDMNIAKSCSIFSDKVRILDRPHNLCGDHVSMNKIIDYDLKKTDGDIYFQTHSTNPLLEIDSINKSLIEFNKNDKYDSLFSVTKHQTRFYWENLDPINHSNDIDIKRTQDLKPLFSENSCIYIFTKESFLNSKKNRIGINPKLFFLNAYESVDIDEYDDFLFAEKLFLVNNNLRGN